MATLNTLRTRYGIVLSVIIALVLLAFILGDQLSYRQGEVTYNDPVVMVIDGQTVTASEYAQIREQVAMADHVKADVYRTYTDKEGSIGEDGIAQVAAELVRFNKYLSPSFEQLAINVYQNEVDAAISVSSNQFATELLGNGWPVEYVPHIVYAEMAMPQFVMESQLANEKFATIATAGRYVNKLEVEERLRGEGYSYSGRYVELPYSAVEISADAVSEEEIAAYYEANRKENVNYGNRTITYVSIPRVASDEDKAAIKERVDAFFAAVESGVEDLEAEANKVGATYVETYREASSLSDEQKGAFGLARYTEPVLSNDAWSMSILIDEFNSPVSFDAEIAVFETRGEADKVAEELMANGGDFAALADVTPTSTNTINIIGNNDGRAQYFAGHAEGDIFTYRVGSNHVVAKVTSVGESKDLVRVADFTKRLVPSEKTLRDLASTVDALLANVGDNVDSFNEATIAAGYRPNSALVRRQNTSRRGVDGITDSRALAIWAYDANVGDKVSMVLNDNVYVAMVKSIDENEYEMRNDADIKRQLREDKQYDKAAAMLSTIDELPVGGELKEFAEIKTTSVDLEPALVCAITEARETGRPVKVRGGAAAYLVVVDDIQGDEITAEVIAEERIPLTDEYNAYMDTQLTLMSLLNGVEVEDLRGKNEL